MVTLLIAAALAAPNPHPWEKRLSEDGVTVWARPVPGSEVLEWRGEAVLPFAVNEVWVILHNLEAYPEFMPYLRALRVLPGGGRTVRYVYNQIAPPVISPRDFAQRIEHGLDRSTGVRWVEATLANDRAPPLRSGVTRMPLMDEWWTLEPVSGGKTRIEYRYHSDPGGWVPNWLINSSGETSIPRVFECLRNRLRDPTWRNKDD